MSPCREDKGDNQDLLKRSRRLTKGSEPCSWTKLLARRRKSAKASSKEPIVEYYSNDSVKEESDILLDSRLVDHPNHEEEKSYENKQSRKNSSSRILIRDLHNSPWPTIKSSSSLFLVLVCLMFLFRGTEGCSSRSTPKPRSHSHSAMRPNITFQTYACPPAYAAWYCLNGATCFTVKIADSILYNCECADGYMGQRCEFKDLDGSYLPAREKLLLLKSAGFGTVFLAGFVIVIAAALVSALYTRHRTKAKLKKARSDAEMMTSVVSEDREGSKETSQTNRLPRTPGGLSESAISVNILKQSISYGVSTQDRISPGMIPDLPTSYNDLRHKEPPSLKGHDQRRI